MPLQQGQILDRQIALQERLLVDRKSGPAVGDRVQHCRR